MTTDPRAAAIEAAAAAMADDWNPDRDPVLTAMFRDYAASAVAAAVPHLTRDLRAFVVEWVTTSDNVDMCGHCKARRECAGELGRALDALERGEQ